MVILFYYYPDEAITKPTKKNIIANNNHQLGCPTRRLSGALCVCVCFCPSKSISSSIYSSIYVVYFRFSTHFRAADDGCQIYIAIARRRTLITTHARRRETRARVMHEIWSVCRVAADEIAVTLSHGGYMYIGGSNSRGGSSYIAI